MKLMSHNSGTGERPANIFARLFPWVARCQDKCVLDQYKEGVRGFDLRVKWHEDDYYIQHGLARYEMTLDECLKCLNEVNRLIRDTCVVMITYEGSLDEGQQKGFAAYIKSQMNRYKFLTLGHISVKKPEWKVIYNSKKQPKYEQNYTKIVGWKALFPFPKLWKYLKPKPQEPDEEVWVMEDFV